MVDVEAYADSFVPKTVHISTGTRVRWINYSGRTHTVTGSDGKWGSGDLLSGESYTVTFDRPGTYQYYCRHHEGMQGTIVVGSGSSARSDY
jgi:plastocyanin